jgi:hypothetical protein
MLEPISSSLTGSNSVNKAVVVREVVDDIVPDKVVVVGPGHDNTEEQNLEAEAVLDLTELIEAMHSDTLDTAEHDGVSAATTAAKNSQDSLHVHESNDMVVQYLQ